MADVMAVLAVEELDTVELYEARFDEAEEESEWGEQAEGDDWEEDEDDWDEDEEDWDEDEEDWEEEEEWEEDEWSEDEE